MHRHDPLAQPRVLDRRSRGSRRALHLGGIDETLQVSYHVARFYGVHFARARLCRKEGQNAIACADICVRERR